MEAKPSKRKHALKPWQFHCLVVWSHPEANTTTIPQKLTKILRIDSISDAIITMSFAEVGHTCPACSKSHKWLTPFFESTLENYDGINAEMLPRIFLQCVLTEESFPGNDACCVSSNFPQVIQEASKLVNLQFHGCDSNISKYPVIVGC